MTLDLRRSQAYGCVMGGDISTRDVYIPADVGDVSDSYAG